MAISALELLTTQVFAKWKQAKEQLSDSATELMETPTTEPVNEPQMPIKSPMAQEYVRISGAYIRLEGQIEAIHQREQEVESLKKELANMKGLFKGRQKKELQEKISTTETAIGNMKSYLQRIVQEYGFKAVQDFVRTYKAAKTEYDEYKKSYAKWEKATGSSSEPKSIKEKLQKYQKQAKEEKRIRTPKKDRGAR